MKNPTRVFSHLTIPLCAISEGVTARPSTLCTFIFLRRRAAEADEENSLSRIHDQSKAPYAMIRNETGKSVKLVREERLRIRAGGKV